TESDKNARADETALAFLKNIDPEELALCYFRDELVTVSEGGTTVGEFTASIEKVTRSGEELILVHASSHGKVDDTPMGTTISTYLRPTGLQVVEQEHIEFVKVPGHELEKKTGIECDPETGDLTVKRIVTQGHEVRKSQHQFKADQVAGLVTEGTNLLLQRLFMRQGLSGEVCFITLDSDSGHLVKASYQPLPERSQKVGKKEIQVSGIERRVASVGDIPYTWQSFFMPDGHLTMRVQIGSPAIVTLEKVPRLIERDIPEPKPVFDKKRLMWEEDMEMNSRFLQRKEELKAGHEQYLRGHPDATALIADFFQFLLLRRPDDVVGFAAEFFSSFSPKNTPGKSFKARLV
uniref:Ciliogenesis-associated TTC17-interacting protein n=1 Tax=Ciona savignyi TaxID=51511 RepID=H2YEP7_CIOSA